MNIIKIDCVYNYNENIDDFENVDKIMSFIKGSIVRTSEDTKIKFKIDTKEELKKYKSNAIRLNKVCYELKDKLERKQKFNKQDIGCIEELILYNKVKNRQLVLMGVFCFILIIISIIIKLLMK